jgi:hypothetical protein
MGLYFGRLRREAVRAVEWERWQTTKANTDHSEASVPPRTEPPSAGTNPIMPDFPRPVRIAIAGDHQIFATASLMAPRCHTRGLSVHGQKTGRAVLCRLLPMREAALDSGTAHAGLITIPASRPWLWADRELREYAALAAAILVRLLLMTVTLKVS